VSNQTTHAATLRKTSLFSDLNDKELARLADAAVPRRFAVDQIIFAEGEPCSGLYVIESGAVKIFKTSIRGREQVLSVEGPASSIAELPVFDGGNYPASAAAAKDSVLLFIGKKEFHALCMEHPEAALKVLKVVGSRLRLLVEIIENLSFSTVRHRLAAYLVRLAREGGTPREWGTEFTLGVTNQQLAAQIGTVRELVSRNLSRLQAEGVIQLDGKKVVVPNLEALEAEAEDTE
jgi:CRP/FNR family transcriptional regulator, cyclic AMP receptor protein